MRNLERRLLGCLQAVFPSLSPNDIPRASAQSVEAWDSLATATLMALVQEEFGISVAPEDLERFVSFREIVHYLESSPAVV